MRHEQNVAQPEKHPRLHLLLARPSRKHCFHPVVLARSETEYDPLRAFQLRCIRWVSFSLRCRLVYQKSFNKRDSDTFEVIVNWVAAGSVLFCELSALDPSLRRE